ncbi:DUF2125 domain-containing protein [Rhodobacter sp. SGA-6-6]|uniref:DUF2125 domain-containing protein n=1 Tax=Rhodobacter sp. SGA-6-6 TaxID=2710882 RepID=UPI0013EBF0A8|nr:DUF2125 domain-containing protein [Rhodobacter sp. SGA-6-6]NGM44970.1 DUF2125 domain-containing protein [Rhodobacter sp. SGA-6-6]
MRFLKWLVVVLLLVACGGWFAAKLAIERGADQALAGARAQGMQAEVATLSVGGFPARLDLRATGVKLADPVSGAGWQAPSLRLHAATWAPWVLTAELPPQQVVTLSGQTVALTSDALRVRLTSAPDPDLPLRRLGASAAGLTAQSDLGWQIGFGEIALALTEDPARGPASYALAFDLAPLRPGPAFLAALAGADLPAEAERIEGDIGLRLTAPLNRHSGSLPPLLDAVEIRALDLGWGALTLHAEGGIAADAEGHAEGRILLELRGWDRLPALLVATGTIKPEVAPTIGNFLRAIAAESKDPEVLALPLVMEGGRMSLGPFPLGPAPMLRRPVG